MFARVADRITAFDAALPNPPALKAMAGQLIYSHGGPSRCRVPVLFRNGPLRTTRQRSSASHRFRLSTCLRLVDRCGSDGLRPTAYGLSGLTTRTCVSPFSHYAVRLALGLALAAMPNLVRPTLPNLVRPTLPNLVRATLPNLVRATLPNLNAYSARPLSTTGLGGW